MNSPFLQCSCRSKREVNTKLVIAQGYPPIRDLSANSEPSHPNRSPDAPQRTDRLLSFHARAPIRAIDRAERDRERCQTRRAWTAAVRDNRWRTDTPARRVLRRGRLQWQQL